MEIWPFQNSNTIATVLHLLIEQVELYSNHMQSSLGFQLPPCLGLGTPDWSTGRIERQGHGAGSPLSKLAALSYNSAAVRATAEISQHHNIELFFCIGSWGAQH